MKAALARRRPDLVLPKAAWSKPWVVDCTAWGDGVGAMAQDVSHGHEFMRRFLQHVLPKGLHKVRYSGLWHPSRRDAAARARQFLALDRSAMAPPDPPTGEPAGLGEHQSARTASSDAAPRICPCCNSGHLVHVRKLYPMQVRGP